MNAERAVEVACPSCGHPTAVWIDVSTGDEEVAEDCQVCCRPLHVHVWFKSGEVSRVEVGRGW